MSDDHTSSDEAQVAEIVARVGDFYTRKGLSPPFHLHAVAKQWLGLSQDEIVTVLEKHFDACRRFYTTGSGDRHFHLVRSAISKAIEAKYPNHSHADDELERPLRKRRGRFQPVAHAGGIDVFDDRDDGGQEDDRTINVERSSSLVGYESAGVPIGEDEEGSDDSKH